MPPRQSSPQGSPSPEEGGCSKTVLHQAVLGGQSTVASLLETEEDSQPCPWGYLNRMDSNPVIHGKEECW